jgi:hypothetical protein
MSESPLTPIKTLRIRPWGQVARDLEAILDAVVERGVRIGDNSRLRKYVKHMREEGAAFAAADRLEFMSQIRSDAEEIVTAVEHLVAPPEVPGWERLFKRIQRGPLIAAPRDDPGRDAQVELLMGSVLRSTNAGVSFRGADAEATYRGHSIGFAAKRPRSSKNLGKLVKDGRDQLARAGGTGVLFLDLSQLAPEHAQVRTVTSYEHAIDVLAPLLLKSLERLREHVPRWIRGSGTQASNVLASIGFVKVRFVIPGPLGEDYGTMQRFLSSQATETPVPDWLRDFMNEFARIGDEPPPDRYEPTAGGVSR